MVDEVDQGTGTAALAAMDAAGDDRRDRRGPRSPVWASADDLDDTAVPDGPAPVNLLPALDSTMMGWRDRGWYLGPHRGPLFDRTGNAGPTVWVGGRAVGAWSQRDGGDVVTRVLEPVDRATAGRTTLRPRAPDRCGWTVCG